MDSSYMDISFFILPIYEYIIVVRGLYLTNNDETMRKIDVHLWQRVIIVELESLCFNIVWDLLKTPQGIKPIRCKWVYKRKIRVDEKIETYVVKVVAKDYNSKLASNYEKPFHQ